MTALKLVQTLGGRQVGEAWMARCPTHNDHYPSLPIRAGSADIETATREAPLRIDQKHGAVCAPLGQTETWAQAFEDAGTDRLFHRIEAAP